MEFKGYRRAQNTKGPLYFLSESGRFRFFQTIPRDTALTFLDTNGVYSQLLHKNSDIPAIYSNFKILEDIDDLEIPPHILDHMYAKKPRDPGSEQTPSKPRKRTKRKDQAAAAAALGPLVMHDSDSPVSKINIIRQHLHTSVYKSLSPSKPKILHGSPYQRNSEKNSSNSSNPPKEKSVTKNSVHLGRRSSKKEENLKMMYASFDDVKIEIPKGGIVGVGGKKDQKFQKNIIIPDKSSTIMDEIQRGGASFDEDILFDFGIPDDDEVIPSTLGAGVDLDDIDDLDAYTNQNQNNLNPNFSKLPPSGIWTKPLKLCPPEISDDDDSNQIMVSMNNNRRPSQDWTSLYEQVKTETDSESESFLSVPNKNTEFPIKPLNFENVSLRRASVHRETTSKVLSPTRRSSRVIKSPAWLKESSKIPMIKRTRKKSSA